VARDAASRIRRPNLSSTNKSQTCVVKAPCGFGEDMRIDTAPLHLSKECPLGQPVEPLTKSSRGTTRLRVLFVEDHPLMLRFYEQVAWRAKLDARFTTTLKTAEHAWREIRPDVVVSEADLPDGHWWRLAASRSAGCPTTRLVLISKRRIEAVEYEKLGPGDMVFLKPVGVGDLLHVIRRN